MENDRIFEYKEIRKNALKRLKSLAIGLTLFAFFVFIIFWNVLFIYLI